ncbi:MAG: NUDIX domain-containing protein [Simkaniaceae bacterium]|nr:NUDIX domain-containing protein [Candidatus Sacchlamyda saccharinae]
MGPKVGIGILVIRDGKILMGKRKNAHGDGNWGFPGGHLEFFETVEDCTKRELLEETGLTANSVVLGPWKEIFFQKEKKHYLNLYSFVTDFSGAVENREPEKNECWQWHPIETLPKPLFTPIEKIAIDNSLSDFLDTHLEKISPTSV